MNQGFFSISPSHISNGKTDEYKHHLLGKLVITNQKKGKTAVDILQPFSFGVTLTEPGHRYFNPAGREFKSMSSFLGQFKNKFDAETMSKASGGKALREAGMKYVSKELLAITAKNKIKQWDNMRDHAANTGTNFHNAAESYVKGEEYCGTQEENMEMVRNVMAQHADAKKMFPEAVIVSEKYGICGTSDMVFLVGKQGGKWIVDIDDYKTNVRRGIEVFSRYKQKMLPPLEHFEDCNFYHYALQVSGYGYILETEHNCIVRRLTLSYTNLETKVFTPYHIPYLKSDFEKLLLHRA